MARTPQRNPDRPAKVALLDANVVYSRVLSDYFVHAQYQRLLAVKWSRAILDEMIRNKKLKASQRLADPSDLRPRIAAVDRLRDYILKEYPDALVEPTAEHFQPFASAHMPDPDDRHVLAAAVAAKANYLCTDNIPDFPEPVLDRLGIRRVTPDALLHSLVAENPLEMVRAHQRAVSWTPGSTHQSTLDTLRRAKALMTADRMERLLTSLGNLDSRDDLAQVYASAIAERDRARTGLLPPSTRRPGPAALGAHPTSNFRDRQRPDQQREAGGP